MSQETVFDREGREVKTANQKLWLYLKHEVVLEIPQHTSPGTDTCEAERWWMRFDTKNHALKEGGARDPEMKSS